MSMSQDSFNTPAAANSEIQELSLPLYESRLWIKIWAILAIVGGVFQALSLVGIIFAWLPIWLGALLLKVVKGVEAAQETGDKFAFIEAQNNLKTFFTILGVISFAAALLSLIAACIIIVGTITGSITLSNLASSY